VRGAARCAALLRRLDRLDGGEDDIEPEVDEVDTGYGDRRFASQYDAFVQKAVDELEQRGVVPGELLHAEATRSLGRPPKRYAGHGPRVASEIQQTLRSHRAAARRRRAPPRRPCWRGRWTAQQTLRA